MTGPTKGFTTPAAGWFVLLDGGIVVLTLLAASGRAHRWATGLVPIPPRRALQGLLGAAVAIHLAEAAWAGREARRHDLPVRPWTLQTLAVGFPSLRELGAAVAAAGG